MAREVDRADAARLVLGILSKVVKSGCPSSIFPRLPELEVVCHDLLRSVADTRQGPGDSLAQDCARHASLALRFSAATQAAEVLSFPTPHVWEEISEKAIAFIYTCIAKMTERQALETAKRAAPSSPHAQASPCNELKDPNHLCAAAEPRIACTHTPAASPAAFNALDEGPSGRAYGKTCAAARARYAAAGRGSQGLPFIGAELGSLMVSSVWSLLEATPAQEEEGGAREAEQKGEGDRERGEGHRTHCCTFPSPVPLGQHESSHAGERGTAGMHGEATGAEEDPANKGAAPTRAIGEIKSARSKRPREGSDEDATTRARRMPHQKDVEALGGPELLSSGFPDGRKASTETTGRGKTTARSQNVATEVQVLGEGPSGLPMPASIAPFAGDTKEGKEMKPTPPVGLGKDGGIGPSDPRIPSQQEVARGDALSCNGAAEQQQGPAPSSSEVCPPPHIVVEDANGSQAESSDAKGGRALLRLRPQWLCPVHAPLDEPEIAADKQESSGAKAPGLRDDAAPRRASMGKRKSPSPQKVQQSSGTTPGATQVPAHCPADKSPHSMAPPAPSECPVIATEIAACTEPQQPQIKRTLEKRRADAKNRQLAKLQVRSGSMQVEAEGGCEAQVLPFPREGLGQEIALHPDCGRGAREGHAPVLEPAEVQGAAFVLGQLQAGVKVQPLVEEANQKYLAGHVEGDSEVPASKRSQGVASPKRQVVPSSLECSPPLKTHGEGQSSAKDDRSQGSGGVGRRPLSGLVRIRRNTNRYQCMLGKTNLGLLKSERMAVLMMEAANWMLSTPEARGEMCLRELREGHMAQLRALGDAEFVRMLEQPKGFPLRSWVLQNFVLHDEPKEDSPAKDADAGRQCALHKEPQENGANQGS